MIGYAQARRDHEYLWSFGPAQDMTGGYVDQEDLERLLKNPTKKMAAQCYCDQIQYWLEAGPDETFAAPWQGGDWKTDRRVKAIAERHGLCKELSSLVARN